MIAINLDDKALPKNWLVVRLAEFADIVMGQSPASESYNNKELGIPFYQGKSDFGDISPWVNKYCSSPHKVAREGATLLSVRAPVGPTNVASQQCCIGRGLAAIHPLGKVDPLFFLFLFRSIEPQISGQGTGSTFKAITKSYVEDLHFAFPPLNEQKRIVAKVEALFSKLDSGIAALKSAREQLKVYRQAVLKHAFDGKLTAQWRENNADKLETPEQLLARIQQERQERYQQQIDGWKTAVKRWEDGGKEGKKPVKPKKLKEKISDSMNEMDMPEGWGRVAASDLNIDVSDGPFGSNLRNTDYVDNGVRVIRLENIGEMRFVEEKYSFISHDKYKKLRKHTVVGGDVVFSSFVGGGIRVAVVPENISKAVNKADCFCVRFFGKTYSEKFFMFFLSSRAAFKQIESKIHGVGRQRVNTSQLKSFIVPVCSAEEQKEVVKSIEYQFSELDMLEHAIDEELLRTETLRQSILKKAFAGELVAQNPDDEPASELLARIKQEKAERQAADQAAKKAQKAANKKPAVTCSAKASRTSVARHA